MIRSLTPVERNPTQLDGNEKSEDEGEVIKGARRLAYRRKN